MMDKDEQARKTLKNMKADMTWAELAQHLGMNKGYLSRVINGKRPASEKLRAALKLTRTYPAHPVMRLTELRRRIRALNFSPEILREIERELLPK
jgi:transcriptional regulator with XRE-family HTH domain